MGVASGCGEQEVGVANGSGWNLWVWLAGGGCGWNLWVWLLGVVVRRYIDFLILLIPTPLVHVSVLFAAASLLFVLFFINPRRACARVTVLVLSVCLCVCFPYSGTSRNQAYKQQYQRLQLDTGMKYKKGFFFKTFHS